MRLIEFRIRQWSKQKDGKEDSNDIGTKNY